jgi:hypothetical protein
MRKLRNRDLAAVLSLGGRRLLDLAQDAAGAWLGQGAVAR